MEEILNSQKSSQVENPVLSKMVTHDHEQVVFCQDNATGLKAIIAIHDTTLGPSLGGTRMWPYANEMEALEDVLRLSRGMTYKAAITGLNLGGGKAVIIGDSYTQKSEALFRRFGKFVNSLGGKYITAEDVGINPQDMMQVNMETNHVSGLPGMSGDPSPVTAYGVYMGIKACAYEKWGSDSLEGKKILVQGVGHVGEYLVELLTKEKSIIYINDINEDRLARVAKKYGVEVVLGEDIYDLEMDIYAPCALGATVNTETLSRLKCSIIAGAANNQLADERIHGVAVMEKGIIYAPDFVINAGGLINVNSEIVGYSAEHSTKMTEEIYNTTLKILEKSKLENIPTYMAANLLAEQRIEAIGKVKRTY